MGLVSKLSAMARRVRLRPKKTDSRFPYVWTDTVRPANRKGHACRIVKGAKSDICTIQFKDGSEWIVRRRLVKHVG